MYSITQVKKNDFPSKGGKYAKTPPLKGLGRVQTIVVPYKTDENDVSASLVIEASKIASRISILNGETKKICQEENVKEITPIDEEDLKHYLEHVLPLNNQQVRKFLVSRAKCGEQGIAEQSNATCHSCNTTENCNSIIHDWTEDKIDKYHCKMYGRELRHIVFTHPCMHGNINVDLSDDSATVNSSIAPLAPPQPCQKSHIKALSAATSSLMQNKNTAVPFMNELIRKISKCHVERPLSLESIEERVERIRNEKIATQEQKRREQLQEYNRLIQEAKINLHPAKQTDEKEEEESLNEEEENEEDQEEEEEDEEDQEDQEDEEDEEEDSLLSTEEEEQEEEEEEEKIEQTCFCSFYIAIHKNLGDNTSVNLLGDFNNWEMDRALKLKRIGKTNAYTVMTRLKPGQYLYKYFINGEWVADEKKQTLIDAKTGVINNVVTVYPEVDEEGSEEFEDEDDQEDKDDQEDVEDVEDEDQEDEENEENKEDVEKDEKEDKEEEDDNEKEENEQEEEEQEENEQEEEEADEKKETISKAVPNIEKLIKEDHFKPMIVKQFCADFYVVICEPRDEFSFFTKFDCPYVLQWVNDSHKAIHIFRRYPLHYYSWTLKRKTQQNFQLLATLETFE